MNIKYTIIKTILIMQLFAIIIIHLIFFSEKSHGNMSVIQQNRHKHRKREESAAQSVPEDELRHSNRKKSEVEAIKMVSRTPNVTLFWQKSRAPALPRSDLNNSILTRFERRLQRIKNLCSKIKPSYMDQWKMVQNNGTSNPNFIASYAHHAINCMVLKAGSSSWNDLFWNLRDPEEWKREHFWEKAVRENLRAYVDLGMKKTAEIWNHEDGVRIVTSRHPFVRLISGFRDKFNKAYYYDLWFKQFPNMKKYPNKFGSWRGTKKYFMKWEDFASYLADYGEDYEKNLDQHFFPITATCDPCSYPFNFIVKLESFQEDSTWLVEHKFKKSNILLKKFNENKLKMKDDILVKTYFSKLKPEIVKKIYKLYRKDMEIFGYTFDLKTLDIGICDD